MSRRTQGRRCLTGDPPPVVARNKTTITGGTVEPSKALMRQRELGLIQITPDWSDPYINQLCRENTARNWQICISTTAFFLKVRWEDWYKTDICLLSKLHFRNFPFCYWSHKQDTTHQLMLLWLLWLDFCMFTLERHSRLPLLPVLKLSYANWLLAPVSYLTERHDSAINPNATPWQK